MQEFRSQEHGLPCSPEDKAPEYDWENFRSFLTTFRQLAISRNETVYVFKVVRILQDYASPWLKEQLSRFTPEFSGLLDKTYQGFTLNGKTDTGEEVSLTSPEILDAIINGRVFHADKKHGPTLKFLDPLERWVYLWPVLHTFIIPVVKGLVWLYKAIREDGVLDNADYPQSRTAAQPDVVPAEEAE